MHSNIYCIQMLTVVLENNECELFKSLGKGELNHLADGYTSLTGCPGVCVCVECLCVCVCLCNPATVEQYASG